MPLQVRRRALGQESPMLQRSRSSWNLHPYRGTWTIPRTPSGRSRVSKFLFMSRKIAVLPGDGIGPEVTAEAIKALQAVRRRPTSSRRRSWAAAAYDDGGHPLPDIHARTLPSGRRRALRRGRRAEVRRDPRPALAPRARSVAAVAEGAEPLRERPPREDAQGARRLVPPQGRSEDRLRRRARADRRVVLRREEPHRQRGDGHLRVLALRDRANLAGRLRGRAHSRQEAPERGQGERAGDLAALAGDGERPRAGSTRTSRCLTCWWTTARCR